MLIVSKFFKTVSHLILLSSFKRIFNSSDLVILKSFNLIIIKNTIKK